MKAEPKKGDAVKHVTTGEIGVVVGSGLGSGKVWVQYSNDTSPYPQPIRNIEPVKTAKE